MHQIIRRVFLISILLSCWQLCATPFDFNNETITSYADQDISGSYTIEDAGASLALTNNTWKKIDFQYDVTADTILEFDFVSADTGEIHGIGFEKDNSLGATYLFQLAGSQSYGISTYKTYSGTTAVHYRIPVGQHYTGVFSYLVFTNDHDGSGAATVNGKFSNVNVYEASDMIDFSSVTLSSYGGQDVDSDATVLNGGTTLALNGNTWQRIDFPYTIAADTVLEFDFQSSAEGEIHGIALDSNDSADENSTFKVFGTQTWGRRNYDNYSGAAWKHYVIPVGTYFTGSVTYLGFVCDRDTAGSANSTFRNVTVYENTSAPTVTTVLPADFNVTTLPQESILKITYNWNAVPMDADYTCFVHIRDNSTNAQALQDDHVPPFPTRTSTWSGITNWTRNITIPSSMANGTYKIVIGLYNNTNGNQSLLAGPGVIIHAGTTHFNVGTFTVDSSAPPPPLDSAGPVTLDLTGYDLTFSEEFDGTLNVSNWGPGTKWIAHTPYAGDFGDAWFTSPTANPSPFSVANGILDITAWYNSSAAHWRSGLLSSVDTNGDGFAQQYGYFEMRAKFPEGPGTWPAFWLLSQNRMTESNPTTYEVDIVEQYGHAPQTLHTVVHTRYPGGTHNGVGNSFFVEDMSAGFHTYGFLYDETDMVWYFDGVELWRLATPDEAKVPLFVMLNLALGAGWPITNTPNPSVMEVDYVRVYAKSSQVTYETEDVTTVAASDNIILFTSSSPSGGYCERLNSNAVGDYVTYTFAPPVGTYRVITRVRKYATRGIFQTTIGDVNMPGTHDQFHASGTWEEVDLGVATFDGSSTPFTFTVTGKNASSSDYGLAFDYIRFEAP